LGIVPCALAVAIRWHGIESRHRRDASTRCRAAVSDSHDARRSGSAGGW
jgi:hypothetical protein